MRDPLPTFVECLLECGSSHRWHAAAQLSQLSDRWRAAIASWREGQTAISITSIRSLGEWLDAWERPLLDATAIRALVRDVPNCRSIQLLWLHVDTVGWRQLFRWPRLTVLLLETCALERDRNHGGPREFDVDATATHLMCARLESLSLWACHPLSFNRILDGIRASESLQRLTLNLQAYTQARKDAPESRVSIDGTAMLHCLATIPTLTHLALYEMEAEEPKALSTALEVLCHSCMLTSFKVAECLALEERCLGLFTLCPSLHTIEWGARSSTSAVSRLLAGCAQLRELLLDERAFPIEEAAVLEIARLGGRLECLSLANNQRLSDNAVLALCGRHSHSQYVGCPCLRRLDLSIDEDSDEGHDARSGPHQLTDGSIGCLCDGTVLALPSLGEINLRGRSGISIQLALALREARPSLSVEWPQAVHEFMRRFSVIA